MERLKNAVDLWEKITEKYNGQIPVKVKVLLCVIVVLMLVVSGGTYLWDSGYITQRWQVPLWDFRADGEFDIIESDIELRAGNIIVTPQIEVIYDKDIVFIINVLYYYEENTCVLSENDNGETRQFRLLAKESQRKKMEALFQLIQETVREEVGESDADKEKKLKFNVVKVAIINAQNLKAEKAKTQYLYIKDFQEDDMEEESAQNRHTAFEINIDEYVVEGKMEDSGEVRDVISACVEKIIDLE